MTDKPNNYFFALWPDHEVRSELVHLQQKVCRGNGRLHNQHDLHMTLVFLGRVVPEQLECAIQVANSVVAKPFDVMLDQIGYWKRPRILWCGPDQIPESLVQLVHDLQHDLLDCGVQPEKRNYKPHVTLARKARQTEHAGVFNPIIWQPDKFVLAASRSGPDLPRYQIIEQWDIRCNYQ